MFSAKNNCIILVIVLPTYNKFLNNMHDYNLFLWLYELFRLLAAKTILPSNDLYHIPVYSNLL